jgi:hypothetical protein
MEYWNIGSLPADQVMQERKIESRKAESREAGGKRYEV